ncbi:pyruvate dehydrogenase [acetyl-transferring]-phosphatase 1, mitochondrial-like [Ruditapes philippinarum]|uniref:pyruvate dehydrogenase [acetyl-transferring]-phosphatase 1, mitochondrial-like n=1 Tax=Ruditapes philippinarum TaxID=129788 RepID=UPI00295C0B15|nr:pyruvate dehydrogenase [acetyl-transferring]-phosphatase 1, mitochondrial-like [Ruditapes philippinarum]
MALLKAFSRRMHILKYPVNLGKDAGKRQIVQNRYFTFDNYPRLSRQQVTFYLRYHEYNSEDLNDGAVKNFMTNKLAANQPIEDRAAQVRLRLNESDSKPGQYIRSLANLMKDFGQEYYANELKTLCNDLNTKQMAGDCKAVLGQQVESETFVAKNLSREHCAENLDEVERLNNQHPNEQNIILRNGRLLGDLAPLRAFGDARYKWPARVMKHVLNVANPNVISIYGENLIPTNYKSPPYLTAEPEVIHHSLKPNDKFLILATDGLWEHLDEQQVVDLVAAHMDERQILTEFVLPRNDITLREVNEILKVRKRKLAKKPEDENVATHLLRMALGPAHGQISQYLTLPESVVRAYRDDITITVIYFDTDYLVKRIS